MSTTGKVIAQITGLTIVWLVLAVTGMVLFGDTIDSHSDWGLVGAVTVVLGDGAALGALGLLIFRVSRRLNRFPGEDNSDDRARR